jgi:biotin operon repressor
VNNVNRRFVAMPDFLKLNKQNLKTLDVLTYVTVRSFHNSKNGKCYPSYEKIMERSGLSRGTVASSIKRLEASGHFKVNHSNRQGTCNQYTFGDLEHFHRIPYEIFDADLTIYEKAFLLCLRSMLMNGLLLYSGSITSLAAGLGLSYQQVYKPYKSLVAKGYIIEKGTSRVYIFLDPKINWEYHYQGTELPPNTMPFILKVA